jgi:hypothetical protein
MRPVFSVAPWPGAGTFRGELPAGCLWLWLGEEAGQAQVSVGLVAPHDLPAGALEPWALPLEGVAILTTCAEGQWMQPLVDWLLDHGPGPLRAALEIATTVTQ